MAFHTLGILEFSTGTYPVLTASGTGSYSSGHYTAPVTTSGTITAVVTPVTGKALQRLPEGSRSESYKTLYTLTSLVTGETDVSLADIVVIDSQNYQVEELSKWEGFDETYYEALIKRVEE